MTAILGFDCSTPATAVALARAGQESLRAREEPGPGQRPAHAAQLLSLCHRLLEQADLRFADLERIAVGLGPGTFTGLRVAIATARGLAHGCATALVGVPTLEVLAAASGRGSVLAVLDARRGEAFAAAYQDGLELVSATTLDSGALANVASSHPWTAVGDGAVRFRAVLERAGCTVPPDGADVHRVDAGTLCALARGRSPGPLGAILPRYLRDPDAQPTTGRRP